MRGRDHCQRARWVNDAITLRKSGETLPANLRDEVLALGHAAVPELLAMLGEAD